MRLRFLNMTTDKDLQNYFIQLIKTKFKNDSIHFNDVKISKCEDYYRFTCKLMFDYTQDANSLFFIHKLDTNNEYNYSHVINFKQYNNYIRGIKLKKISYGNN